MVKQQRRTDSTYSESDLFRWICILRFKTYTPDARSKAYMPFLKISLILGLSVSLI